MKKFFGTILYGMVDALHTRPTGFSARKLTAFVTVMCIIYIHTRFVDVANSVTVLVYDMVFVLLLLGIVTIDQLYRFKTGASLNAGTVNAEAPSVSGTTATNVVVNDGPPADMKMGN